MDSIRNVGIVGSGFMGWQITLQCASNGYPVVLTDISNEALSRALGDITKELNSRIQRGLITKRIKNQFLKNIYCSENLDAVRDSDLIIEATPEKLKIKREVFHDLD